MVENKTTIVRRHVLSLLEEGALKTGEQVPSARELSVKLGISFLKVQQAIETLCQDGVMEAYSRKGTYVQRGWEERVLPENLAVFNHLHRLPWVDGMLKVMEKEFAGLRMTYAFKRGMLELRTTRHVLTGHDEYMDLTELFEECYPDRSIFFEKPFRPFHINGRIVGIPYSFSPRVVLYNPKQFRSAGCAMPQSGWTWEEFLECIARLKKVLPAKYILNWHCQSYAWLNILLRAGGRLFTPNQEDPVTVDSPRSILGLSLFNELGNLLERPEYDEDDFHGAFLQGSAGMLIVGRQFLDSIDRAGFKDWASVPLPHIPGGEDITAQATDLVCVRKSCTSMSLARKYISVMLSEPVQDYLAQRRYSIPIRKSSAFKSLDLTDPRDALFAAEMGKASIDFNIAPPFPGELVLQGIERILTENLDLDSGLRELGQMARTYMGIYGHYSASRKSAIRTVFAGNPGNLYCADVHCSHRTDPHSPRTASAE
ncbi:MAG: extracellular solute-binding protein [Candidatus Methylacidiphilales bacterium]|nr:extracellular solute-binding protein [Candidatus Methylacidiphilales bacterium]